MSTTEIGALIISLRSESAAFRAEMDKSRTAIKGVGDHAALSSRSLARFAAIGAEQVIPGLQGSRLAVEGFLQALQNSRIAIVAMLAPIAKLAAAGAAGFLLGNAIRNFIELREAGHGWIESLKLAVGATKDYEEEAKKATEEQKKFSAAQAAARAVSQGLSKELATLTNDYRKLAELAENERRARIETLPIGAREIEQRKSELITTLQLREARQKILEDIKEGRERQVEQGQKAAAELKLSPGGLIFGLKEIDKFKKDVDDLEKEIKRLAAQGIPARDLFALIDEGQQKVDAGIEEMKQKFGDVPTVFNRLVDLQRSLGGGEFRRGLDDTVKGMQKLAAGSARVEDELGTVVNVTLGKARQGFSEAGEAGNFFAGVMFEDIPNASNAAAQSFVVVTGQLNELAIAFARAREQAVFFETVVGSGGNVAVAAPGNF